MALFDISYLRHLPNMTVMAPKDENELQHMLATAVELGRPAAIRYPRGNGYGVPLDQIVQPIKIGCAEKLRTGRDAVVLAFGSMVYPAVEAAGILEERFDVSVAVVNARFVKPLDETLILEEAARYGRIITLEENVLQGGFGTAVLELLEERGILGVEVLRLGYPEKPIQQGEQQELRAIIGLDAEGLAKSIHKFVRS